MYYDERWVSKQTEGFKKWLNFVLTPPEGFDDIDEVGVMKKLDVAKLWSVCSSGEGVRVPRAPTREVLSMRAYSVRRDLNILRRNACALWRSPMMANMAARVEVEVEKFRFRIRDDRALAKDIGVKKKFLALLLSYNPLWLRIGLETVFGEILFMAGVADPVSLSHFILTRMLSNPDILAEFAHPTVPHHYRPGLEAALKQFALKKFLHLVLFLDTAKSMKLIKHNPCLFCKDSEVKVRLPFLSCSS